MVPDLNQAGECISPILLLGYNPTSMLTDKRLFILPILLLVLILVLPACDRSQAPMQSTAVPETLPGVEATPVATSTPFQPSPTPVPLAARVNGEPLLLSAYQAELARYKAALGGEPTPEELQLVLDDLVDQMLLAQAAASQGFVASDDVVQERLDELASRLGSQEDLQQWMAANGYVEAEFRQDLARAVQAAWMRDQIASGVPVTTEQVHARQILLSDSTQANDILALLQSGSDFTNLAYQVDPVAGGELGWFGRGTLFYPELEEAAFALQPGQVSSIIETPVGYHILQVLERQDDRLLSPQALLKAQEQAVAQWLDGQRSQGQIEILN
jgi:peptidyl-prolyl cis-trans isomerase C